jgi:N-formylglutamate amidohydrolase
MHKSCLEGVYHLSAAADPLPLVFDSPHSGTHYPADFDYACDPALLEKAEDKYVEELFETAPAHGGCLLAALFPRSYIDLNRAADDIDPELLDGKWPDKKTINPSNRSYAGIGLVRRLVKPGEPVYSRALKPEEIQHRIESYYRPYHDALEQILDGAHYKFGQVWHINCHSMPSAGKRLGAMGRVNPFPSPDFVLGDRDGTSCDLDFTHALRDFLKNLGYKVAVNDPYKGVELVKKYSAPAEGRHSIQIEICKALYLDEDTYKKNRNFERLKVDIDKLIGFCADYASANLMPMAAD